MKFFPSLVAVAAFFLSVDSIANSVTLNYVPPASNLEQQGFIRITNVSSTTITVSLTPIDDAGHVKDNVNIFLAAYETKTFNSSDLENGNVVKGLASGFGSGVGNWRIVISSDDNITAMGLIRSPNGFLNSVHDVATYYLSATLHDIGMFNPAKNPNQVSKLRLSNNVSENNDFDITGVDDAGNVVGPVSITLAPLASATLTSIDLEQGNPQLGLSGAFGAGTGKWRLIVSSTKGASVLSLMELPGGYISNLSSSAGVGVNKAADETQSVTCADISGASVFSQDDLPVYLGFFGSSLSSNSINNTFGSFGSSVGTNSVRNSFSKYGSSYGLYSAKNSYASYPPVIVKNGKSLAFLTDSNSLTALPMVSLATIDSVCSLSAILPAKPFVP